MTNATGEEPERGRQLTAAPGNKGVDAAVAAARRVIDALLHAGDNSAAQMSEIADQLNDVADHVSAHAPAVQERMVDMWRGEGVSRYDPVTGPENAIAPPLVLHGLADGSVAGVVALGFPYQGPPGYVHGGVSAMLLDHALGVANHWVGTSGMTGTLTLRYHRPTPLFEPLTVTARRRAVEGRKIYATGSIAAAGRLRVSADAVFVAKRVE